VTQTALAKVNEANAYIGVATTGYALACGLSSAAASSAPVEPSGGSPAYARVASNWGTPNAVTGVTTGAPGAINVPAGYTVASVPFFTALTGGSYFDGANVTSQSYASQGTYQPLPTLTPS